MNEDHVKIYDKETNPHAVYKIDDNPAVDLFPYKIKDRDRFYDRDHPEDLDPSSPVYDEYWASFEKRCIEGWWVKDEGDTWVFMPPKLFYFINYVSIKDENAIRIKPLLRDIEWIQATYYLCMEGFSGFENDDKYTSHHLVKKHNDGKLDDVEISKIPKSCYKKDGTLKEYVDPWDYLTRTYLIDDPRGNLGRPLYGDVNDESLDGGGKFHEGQRGNGFVLGARGVSKSVFAFLAQYMQEFTFSGVKFSEQIEYTSRPLNFGLGCSTRGQLQRSLNLIRQFYDDQPGKYKHLDADVPDYMGPFYKNYSGGFSVGKEMQHVIKDSLGNIEMFGNTTQMSVLGPDRKTVGAGDRSRYILIEEVGLIGDILEDIYNITRDSLSLYGRKVGSLIGIGTSGDLLKIKGAKKLFENTEKYEIFGIPNYWENPTKKIGLFLPVLYKYRDYEDSNGNLNVVKAFKRYLKDLEDWMQTMNSVALTSEKMNNPLIPRDMLIPNQRSIMPKREAQKRMADIDAWGLFETWANSGVLEYNPMARYGVEFKKDMDHLDRVIQEYNVDFDKVNIEGRFVMYEPPEDYIPENTYFVVYDPAAKSGEGTSLHACIVYKHFKANGGWLRDGIAACWTGRLERLEDNYKQVIKIARYFNATIFPEINVAGFVEYCRKEGLSHMLQRDSYEIEREISPNANRSYYKVGFQMYGERKVWWCTEKLSDWLTTEKAWDPQTKIPIKRNIDDIFDKRILDEIINFDDVGNFDYISCLKGLMLLIGQLEFIKPEEKDKSLYNPEYIPEPIIEYNRPNSDYLKRRLPSSFETM